MKVIEFITRLNIGGPAFHIQRLADGLNKRGMDTIIVCGTTTEEEGSVLHEVLNTGIKLITIPELKSRINPLNDLIAFIKFILIIKREKPDIIHSHTAKAGFIARITGLIFKIFRKKILIIHTYHGFIFEGYFSKPVSKLILLIEKILCKLSDKIICVSKSLYELAIKKYKLSPPYKLEIIPYGITSFNLTSPQKEEKNSYDFRFGIVGRLVPVKGHELFLESAKLLLDRNDGKVNLKFIITGDGPERKRLESLARNLNLEDRIIFKGWMRTGIYNDIDVLCLTSKNEGLPYVILEAMLLKKPVIAINVGGVGDIFTIVEEKSDYYICREGILVKKRDPGAFADAMYFILNENKLYQEMGEFACRNIMEYYREDRMIEAIEKSFLALAREHE